MRLVNAPVLTRTIGSLAAGWALILVLAVACSPDPVPLDALRDDAVILAFGDSLTFGTGAPAEQSYPAVLAALSGRRVINAGVPGEVSADGRARLPALLDAHAPQLLILCHGGNDLLRRLDAQETARNLRDMVRAARARGVAVVLVGVPRLGLPPAVPGFYRDIAEEYRLPYAEDILLAIERDQALKSDPIHPNGGGYRRLAETLYALLRSAGAV